MEIHMSKKFAIICLMLSFYLPSGAWAQKTDNGKKEGCSKDTDCKGSRICENGQCVESSTALTDGVADKGCSKDTDCKGSRVCEKGQCVDGDQVIKTVKSHASIGKGKKVGGSGTLDAGNVNKVLKSRVTALKKCYEKALKNSPTLEGKMSIRFTIGTSGKVTSASIDSDSINDSEISSCVLGKVKTFVFIMPEGGAVEYVFPVVFKPAGEMADINAIKVARRDADISTTGAEEKTIKSHASIGKGKKVGGSGVIDESKVNKVVKSGVIALKMCYEKALKKSPTLEGKISIRFTIGTSGKVTSASIDSDSINDSEVSSCILGKVKTFVFIKPDGGAVEYVFPVVFKPAG